MRDITIENFETEAIGLSLETPVLLYFWANEHEVCRALGERLEAIETLYNGRFILAKIDSMAQSQIVQACKVRSVPTCILVDKGQFVNGFMGDATEEDIKNFLDQFLPSEEEVLAKEQEAHAEELLRSGDLESAMVALQEALSHDPKNLEVRYDLAKTLLEQQSYEEAKAVIEPALSEIPYPMHFGALLDYARALEITATSAHNLEALSAAITANKRDFEARYQLACLHLKNNEYEMALDELLEIIMRDKSWSDELARKTVVGILEYLTPKGIKTKGDDHKSGSIELSLSQQPSNDPQRKLVDTYRRRLSMMLN